MNRERNEKQSLSESLGGKKIRLSSERMDSRINPLELEYGQDRMSQGTENKMTFGKAGKAVNYKIVKLSEDTVAVHSNEGVNFINGNDRVLLTKQELIAEIKNALESEYITIKDVWDEK